MWYRVESLFDIEEDHTHFKTSVESTEPVVDDGNQGRDGGSVLHEAPLTIGDRVRLSEKFINILHMAFQDFAYDREDGDWPVPRDR